MYHTTLCAGTSSSVSSPSSLSSSCLPVASTSEITSPSDSTSPSSRLSGVSRASSSLPTDRVIADSPSSNTISPGVAVTSRGGCVCAGGSESSESVISPSDSSL